MRKTLKIIIVGGGVAGLSIANALASKRYKAIVLEKTKQSGEVDRGDVLHHSSMELIKKWGLYDEFLNFNPKVFYDFKILNNEGKLIFDFNLKKLIQPTCFTVLRHKEIELFLESTAIKTGLIEIIRGETCKELIVENEIVIGVKTQHNTYFADLTIIANGAKSKFINKYFKPTSFFEYSFIFYNVCYKLISDYDNCGYYVLGDKGNMILVALPNNEMRIGIQFKKKHGISKLDLAEIIKNRLSNFPIEKLEFLDGHIYSITNSICPKWWIKGAVIVGDAAHTVHPAGGQGMNLAFSDAETFVTVLDKYYETEGLDNVCDIYSKIRKKEVAKALKKTHLLGTLGEIQHPIYCFFRERFLQFCNNFLFLKQIIFKRIVNVE
ncbi:MAG: NAD(P)/FAD-dependent oxidoreductase [Saprospiraceae bacterium]|jgi:2-polyprenyl-6-methoxyphenol hydroxylase-like FAD-dependent oxidoreductase